VSPFTVKDKLETKEKNIENKEEKDFKEYNPELKQTTKTFNYPNINYVKGLHNNISAFPKKMEAKTLSSSLFNSLKLKNYNKNKTSNNFNQKLNKIKESTILTTETAHILTSIKSYNKLYTNPELLKTEPGFDIEGIQFEKSNIPKYLKVRVYYKFLIE